MKGKAYPTSTWKWMDLKLARDFSHPFRCDRRNALLCENFATDIRRDLTSFQEEIRGKLIMADMKEIKEKQRNRYNVWQKWRSGQQW